MTTINEVNDPVPATNTGMYIEEVGAIISILFRTGIAQIVLGIAVCVFSIHMFIWPIGLGLLAVILGINCMCHFREYTSVITNNCCCAPLTAIMVNYYGQPFICLACLGAVVCAAIELINRVKGNRDDTSDNEFDATDIAMSAVALVTAALLAIPSLWAASVVPRLLKMTEVHPEIGDEDKIREHGEVFEVIARRLELRRAQAEEEELERQQRNTINRIGGRFHPMSSFSPIHNNNTTSGENDDGEEDENNNSNSSSYPPSTTIIMMGSDEQEQGRAVNPEERLRRRRRIFEAQLSPSGSIMIHQQQNSSSPSFSGSGGSQNNSRVFAAAAIGMHQPHQLHHSPSRHSQVAVVTEGVVIEDNNTTQNNADEEGSSSPANISPSRSQVQNPPNVIPVMGAPIYDP